MATNKIGENIFVSNGSMSFGKYSEETLLDGPSLMTTTLPFVDYRLNNLFDYSGRGKTLIETGTLGASIVTTNGPTIDDGYLQLPVGNTVSANIAPTDQYITIANATGTGSGMIISFDMNFNGSIPTGDGYVFTIGTPQNGGSGDNAASIGLNFGILNNQLKVLLTSINSATNTVIQNYLNYTLVPNTWMHVDIRVPKTLTGSTVTIGLYINGILLTPSFIESTTPSLVISYNGGLTNNNLLKFYRRDTTQLSNFKIWLSDNLNVLTTVPSSITPVVDYKFYDSSDFSTNNKSLVLTGSDTAKIYFTSGGPREGDAYLRLSENNTVSVRIQPITSYTTTIAKSDGTGTGMIISFDIKLNNTSNVETPIFTIGNRPNITDDGTNSWVTSTNPSKGFMVRYFNGYLSYAFIDGNGNYTIYNNNIAYNALLMTKWSHIDIKIPKNIANLTSGIEVYIDGELITDTFSGSSSSLDLYSTNESYDSTYDKTFPVAPVDPPSATTKSQYLSWFKSMSLVMQNTPYNDISYKNLGSPVGASLCNRSTMLADGRILFLTRSSSASSCIYTPINDGVSIGTVITTGGYNLTDNTRRSKGTLLKDGRILFIPDTTLRFCIYTPDYVNLSAPGTYNLTTTPDASLVGVPNAGYTDGALLPDGRVVCVPFTATRIGIYTPDYVSSGVGTFNRTDTPTAEGYSGCTLLPDGRVIFVPKTATRIGIYTPDSGVGTFINTDTPLATNYDRCILLSDGRVLFISAISGIKLGIYTPDYVSNGVGTFDNIFTPSLPTGVISGSCLLSDGRVLIYKSGTTNTDIAWIGIYTPDSNGGTFTYSTPFGFNDYNKLGDCNLMRDGRVIITPTAGFVYAAVGSYPTSHEFCIRPFSRYF